MTDIVILTLLFYIRKGWIEVGQDFFVFLPCQDLTDIILQNNLIFIFVPAPQ